VGAGDEGLSAPRVRPGVGERGEEGGGDLALSGYVCVWGGGGWDRGWLDTSGHPEHSFPFIITFVMI
jgi:hypothetical protein